MRPARTDRMSTNGAPLLALEGVSKRFGPVQALEGVDFEVRGGEVVALVGDNGAGKSTLVKSISGIHATDEGRFMFEGRAGEDQRARSDAVALGIATVYQDLALCDNLDVVANLFLGQEVIGSGVGTVTHAARRDGDGAPVARAARAVRGDDPERALEVGGALRRPAPAGRGRALAARRAEGRAARRAHGGARRRPDRARCSS